MNFKPTITNKTYLPRLKTDKLFELPVGSFDYTGEYDRAVRFVAEHQSKNTVLWRTFVEQYKNPVDANDGGWRGEFWGKMMRSACLVWSYTRDDRLKKVIDDAFIEELFASMTSLYKLDQIESGFTKTKLGDMPIESKLLLGSLGVVWLGIGSYFGVNTLKQRKKK